MVQERGLGQGAFRYENVKEAAPFVNDLRLLVRDSNLECELQVQSLKPLTGQHVTAAWPVGQRVGPWTTWPSARGSATREGMSSLR